MIINTNIQAMSAAKNFGINTKNKAKSAEKLSSGYSINRAADDAEIGRASCRERV